MSTEADLTPGNASLSATRTLCALTAGEIMTVPVKTAQEGWSVKMLMEFFSRNGISGAPVTTNDGALVGVVTLSDVVRFENMAPKDKEVLARASWYGDYAGLELSEEERRKLLLNTDINCTVSQIMTACVIQVESAVSVVEVARIMRDRHIHRVFVAEAGKVVGVVSTTCILNALIHSCQSCA